VRKLLLGAVCVLSLGVATPSAADASVKWLCRPGATRSPCNVSLKTTLFSSLSKRIGVGTPVPMKKTVDCFYVYPTVSNQQTTVTTKAADPEIRDIALFQAARFSQVCRVFAPLYRQITVLGIQRDDATAADVALGDKDLREAWRHYLEKWNKGRGVVLIGHSQGTFRLTSLIRKQIDDNAKLRKRLVSALLLGGNVTVREGSDRGGSFKNVPACRRTTQIGCVVAFSTFNATPPANAIFGRTTDANREVLCTNPARLGGGSSRLDSIEPTKEFAPGTLINLGIKLLDLPLPPASTPFIESRSVFSGRCVDEGGAHVLKVTSLPGAPVPKASPDATWGLHLIDANVAQGDLVRLVAAQARAAAEQTGVKKRVAFVG
jgi:Protein of unknown function (DUF3089)